MKIFKSVLGLWDHWRQAWEEGWFTERIREETEKLEGTVLGNEGRSPEGPLPQGTGRRGQLRPLPPSGATGNGESLGLGGIALSCLKVRYWTHSAGIPMKEGAAFPSPQQELSIARTTQVLRWKVTCKNALPGSNAALPKRNELRFFLPSYLWHLTLGAVVISIWFCWRTVQALTSFPTPCPVIASGQSPSEEP